MKQLLQLNTLIPLVLTGILLASLPFMYFPFLGFLAFATKVFLIICLLDFIRKTDWRKTTGLVLIRMFCIAIFGLLFLAVLYMFGKA